MPNNNFNTFATTTTANTTSIYLDVSKSRGNKRLTFFFYLLATFIHLNLLIALNMTEIKTNTTGKEKDKKETLILMKTLPPAAEPPKIDTPKPISQALTRMGNANPGGGGGGGKMFIDDRLIEQIKSDNSEQLKDMTLEDLQKILPEKGEEDMAAESQQDAAPQAKAKDISRSKTNRTQPVIALKKGYRYGIKGGKGTVRSFESALKQGLFGIPSGTGNGLGSGSGDGHGPGSGGGWGGGSGGGIGGGVGSGAGWGDGEDFGGRDVDGKIKSERIIKSTVRVFVLPDGSVDKVDLLKSSGFVELDTLALENGRQAVYEPLELKPGEEEKPRIYDIEIEFSQIK